MPGRAFSGRVWDRNFVLAPLIVAPGESDTKLTARRRGVPAYPIPGSGTRDPHVILVYSVPVWDFLRQ